MTIIGRISPEIVHVESDGDRDYMRLCHRHEWASIPTVMVDDLLPCPFCRAEIEAFRGKLRYLALTEGEQKSGAA